MVNRTMFETDRIPRGWADRLNNMVSMPLPVHSYDDTAPIGQYMGADIISSACIYREWC
jgi:hypothetical protein